MGVHTCVVCACLHICQDCVCVCVCVCVRACDLTESSRTHLAGVGVDVLPVHVRLVEHLVLPHVHVQDHDHEDDAVVEPFA